jgi:hypothetical protein
VCLSTEMRAAREKESFSRAREGSSGPGDVAKVRAFPIEEVEKLGLDPGARRGAVGGQGGRFGAGAAFL